MRTIMLHEVGAFLEQILQTQQGAYAFVEGIFVSNHATAEFRIGKLP
jgi:hypothetical protein